LPEIGKSHHQDTDNVYTRNGSKEVACVPYHRCVIYRRPPILSEEKHSCLTYKRIMPTAYRDTPSSAFVVPGQDSYHSLQSLQTMVYVVSYQVVILLVWNTQLQCRQRFGLRCFPCRTVSEGCCKRHTAFKVRQNDPLATVLQWGQAISHDANFFLTLRAVHAVHAVAGTALLSIYVWPPTAVGPTKVVCLIVKSIPLARSCDCNHGLMALPTSAGGAE
jgi:hypothetical protein